MQITENTTNGEAIIQMDIKMKSRATISQDVQTWFPVQLA